MVIQMVPAEIGEGAGVPDRAVKPILIQTVAGRLAYRMGDAALGQRGKMAMQIGGIGAGQPPRRPIGRALDAQCSQIAAGAAHLCPDLPRKAGDGGLAVGAGHGSHDLRLRGIETGAEPRIEAPGRGIGDGADRIGQNGSIGRFRQQDRGGPAHQRVGDKMPPVGLCAGQGGEQISLLHLAAVSGQAANVDTGLSVKTQQPAKRLRRI